MEATNPITAKYGRCCGCWKNFSEQFLPRKLKCGHFFCNSCCPETTPLFRCFASDCDEVSTSLDIEKCSQNFTISLQSFVNFQKAKKKTSTVEEKLDAITRVPLICTECRSIDNERNMQFCKTCSPLEFENIEIYATLLRVKGVNSKSVAICAVCAIRKHARKGHDTKDFFPILRNLEFIEHSEKLEKVRGAQNKAVETLEMKMGEFMTHIAEGDDQLDRMTDMIRRSKTTAIQTSISTKICEKAEKYKRILKKLDEGLTEAVENLNVLNIELAATNDAEDEENCDKDPIDVDFND